MESKKILKPESSEHSARKGFTVLLADDDVIENLIALETLLEQEGRSILTAQNGKMRSSATVYSHR